MDCANLVKKASTPPKDGSPIEVVSIACLKPIKLLCREQQGAAKELFYYLSLDLSKRNGVIRLRVLFVMDYLLHRSKEFRLLVFSDLRQISKCMGLLSDQNSASDRSVPIVTSHAQELLTKGKELIEIWDHLYGDRYPQLRAIARYFRESLRLQMPNILVSFSPFFVLVRFLHELGAYELFCSPCVFVFFFQENAAFHAERTERNKQHSLNLLLLQRNKLLEAEWPSCMNEWKTSVGRLEECFNILFPRFSDTPVEDASKTRDPVPPPTASASAATAADQDDVDWVNEEELDESSAHTNALVGRTTEAAVAAEAAEFGDRTASAGAPYTLVRSKDPF